MSNKMLIDASHPEETRVAVVRGNRIEEFDFESQEKRQLRGNIYLAKVTRVEPSLQAAFIDYGGNRHGFLAFSEIHPDYYQIPVADRQALLEAEAAEALASREAEEAEDDNDENATASEKQKRKPRRRKPRKAAAESDEEVMEDAEDKASDPAQETDEVVDNPEVETSDSTEPVTAEANTAEEETVEAKPKRRATRRKPKAAAKEPAEPKEPEAESSENTDVSETDDDGSNDPTTMAAVVETDSISESLPGDDENEEDNGSDDEVDGEVTAVADEKEEKPKKRRSPRRKKAVAEETAEEPAAEEVVEAESAVSETVETEEETEQPEEESKPAKPRRRSRRKKAAAAEDNDADSTDGQEVAAADADDNDDTESSEDDDVESVGQEDALEEAAAPRRMRKQYKIQEVIKRRQILLVQVVKEERGNKGAALTTYLSLAGRYSVLMPNTARGGGISRKITNSADRKRLKAIASELEVPNGMGVILRTAGASRTKVEITRDFQYLMRLWEQVRNLTLSSTAPCLVYEEGSLIKRSIRDLYDKDTGEILVAGEKGFNEARDFMGMLMPSHVKKVKQYKDAQAIFTKYGVETQLENMVSPQVTLKSGGYLVINQTEALVAVDVNSGRSTREHSIESTALQTNLEAAEELARQLRLRDLAGLIVIDFIDMEERRNNRAVEKKLKDCLKNDRARIQVGRISHFGLLEMSRQRMRASVLESTMVVCKHCAGVGYVRSESAMGLHVFRAVEEHVSRNRKWNAVVNTTRDIATHMLNNKRAALVELEQKSGLQITIQEDSNLYGQQFEIEKGERTRVASDQTAIGFDTDSPIDDVEITDGEEDDNEKRGRKRNRRRKRRDRNEDMETNEVEMSETEAKDEASADSADDDEQPRKKRRRGKRGGRRRNENDTELEAGAEVETAESGDSREPDTEAPSIEASALEDTVVTSEEDEKPARRSTRRKKAPVSAPAPETEPENTSDSATSEATATEEPPRPKRRTTRRKPVEKPAVEETAAMEQEAETISEPVSNADASDDTSETDPDKKSKRSGWWSRGGGFF